MRLLFSPRGLAGKTEMLGEVPSGRELYGGFLKMAWPAMLESLLLSLVNVVDSIMVSSCGTNAVAAVGLTNQPRMLFFAVFFSLSVSVTAIVARRRGQNDREGANACLSQALGVCFALIAVLFTVSMFVSEPLLDLAGAKPETIVDATRYFRITMAGLMFTAVGMTINAAQRGSGNTKIAMRSNAVANITNIIFNYLLINGVWFFPELGITGAAIATLLGNIAAFIMSVSSLFGGDKFLSNKKINIFRWDKNQLATIGRIASGAGVEQLFMRFGFFIYSVIVANLGTAEIATHTICMNIQTLSLAFGDGLSVAASALIGQNLGRKRPDLATLYAKAGQRMGISMSVILILVFTLLGGPIMLLFLKEGDVNYDYVYTTGRNILFIIAAVAPALISQVIFNGSLRGAGDTKYVAITSAISIAVFRPVTAYILCYTCELGLYGAWISLLIDQYMRLAFSAYRFGTGKWAKVKI
ncbi:MAG: MATE family efflux transporter [Clostridia bacterium]|nr:MATE family efflux transporter [Clostridia bacterium]